MNTYKSILINKELRAEFARVGNQDVSDPIVLAKFFNPCGTETWYAISYNPETNTCFGYVMGLWEDELGYFSIDELESLRSLQLSLPMERDLYFKPCRLSEVKEKMP